MLQATAYFIKDTDVDEHRFLYVPIFLSTDRVFVLFLTTYQFVEHTQLTRPSSFRQKNNGVLKCEIPKWTSKKFEIVNKVLA
jgi:hypothetical protein